MVVKAGELLARRVVLVPQRTLHRYALEVPEHSRAGRRGVTARVADGEPRAECRSTSGGWACVADRWPDTIGWRALIFTGIYSRHCCTAGTALCT